MVESNGSLKTVNGHANGKLNGQPVARRKTVPKRKGFFSVAFHIIARLATWAAIFNILFRCPSSLEACDETSPYICKPYFQLKNAVSPHVQPYYDQYASPYVELARPYYETVDSKVWTPARAYAIQYGAPYVEKGREHAWAQWEKNGRPQLDKIQDLTQEKYDQIVAPYVNQAGETIGPYYEIARTNALQAFYEYVLPSYEFVHPYAAHGYGVASDFTTNTALPTAYWAWNKTYVFLDTAVWPQLRVVYLENVEPQLVRIGERLGRYKHGKAIHDNATDDAPTESVPSTFTKPAAQSVSSSVSSSVVSSSTSSAKASTTESVEPQKSESSGEGYVHPVQAPPREENESERRRKAREMVAEDLEMWQNKFATQADEGATDIEERIDEIAKRMIRRNAKTTGKALFEKLESTIDTEVKALKIKISDLVGTVGEDIQTAEDEVVAAVRSVGVAIKEKAQAIREWRDQYDRELQKTVVGTADVHFQILDETRNLALQQIGMRWAWTDGVTYKDWAKYHELKKTLSEWTEQLKELIVTHPSLLEAQDASAQIEDEGMEIASTAAKELARLKEVAHWKLVARDATDNFETEAMKLAAETVEKAQASKDTLSQEAEDLASSDSEVIDTASSSVVEAVEKQSTAASQSASSILSAGEEEATEKASDLSSTASDILKSVADEASSVASQGSEAFSSTTESIVSTASEASQDVSSVASNVAADGQAVLGDFSEDFSREISDDASTASETISSVLSEVSEDISDFLFSATEDEVAEENLSTSSKAAEASEALRDDAQSLDIDAEDELPVEDVESIEADPLTQREEAPAKDSEPVKPAFLGAAAQKVPERKPILEDYIDTDVVESATNAAQAAYSSAVAKAAEQYSSAASVVSAQIYGTPKPVHEQLFSSLSGAYENALAAANARLNDAVEAASGLKPTPTPTSFPNYVDWERVESIASQRLNEGRLWAELQYSSAMIALGMATPTPSSNLEKYYEQAKFNYYAGLGLAQDRYANFMSGASSALSSLTATPTPTDFAGTASSIASVARESAASAARAAGDAAESVYNAAGDTVSSAAQAVDDSVSSVVDAASEQISSIGEAIADSWDNTIAQISGRVYGDTPQIGWYDNLFNDASSYAAAATDAAAKGASSASDAAGSSAATASAEAAKQYAAVNELVSELIHGKEPTFSESVLSRLQAAYSTAAANIEGFASEASQAASSVGDKVGSAAGQATDAVKQSYQGKDEL